MRLSNIAVAALAGIASSSGSEPSRLLIQRIGPSASTIHIASPDGSAERGLLAASALDYNGSVSPDGQWIVFTSERDGSADLYRAHLDGSSLERLTTDPGFDDQACWSPDGSSIALVSTRGSGTTDVWVFDLSTRQARNITRAMGGDFRPSWSPDGRWIAFSSDRGTIIERNAPEWEHLHRTSLYVIQPNGQGLRRLTDGRRFTGSPKWSSDGRRIVFYEMDVIDTHRAREIDEQSHVTSQIVSMDIESGARTVHTSGAGLKLSPQFLDGDRIGYLVKTGPNRGVAYSTGERGPAGDLRNPNWSHDGRLLVYDRGRAGDARVEYQPLQKLGSTSTRFKVAQLGRLGAYSPDGHRLAFSDPEGPDAWAIVVMDADGTSRHRVFFEPGAAALAPRWSHDAQRIVFGLSSGFESRNTPARIMVMQADGSNPRIIATGAGAGFPSLSPDGQRLVFRVWGGNAGERGLRIVTLATGAVTALTGNDYDTFPEWSPQGDRIAFTSWRNGDFDIYTIRADGTGLKQLTTTPGNDAHSSWSPDGRHLMFSSSRFGFKDEAPLFDDQPQPYGEVFVMRADGTDQRPVTDNQWEDGPGTWQPARGRRQQ